MNGHRYLNAILTVIAGLLAVMLWTNLAGRPLLASEAAAQSRAQGRGESRPPSAPPNAAAQRQEMIRALRDMKRSVDALESTIQKGQLKVRIQNLDDVVGRGH